MSRGLGSLQRDILEVYDASVVSPPSAYYATRGWRRYDWLREHVARLRGIWCEEDCLGPLRAPMARHRPHTPRDGALDVAFARAVRTLIRRGVLVAVTPYAGTSSTVRISQRVEAVQRAKCSKQC
jgi:hypothetical protein